MWFLLGRLFAARNLVCIIHLLFCKFTTKYLNFVQLRREAVIELMFFNITKIGCNYSAPHGMNSYLTVVQQQVLH